MAIYYVSDTDGDNGDSGLTEALAWATIAKVNGETFVAGDSILFNRGDTWREQLTVPLSGTSGNPVTFGAYGTGAAPIISGADILTTWVVDGGSYKKAGITTEPNEVFYDGVRLTENDGATNTVGSNEWDWAADTLYVNVGEDPDTGVLEASQRSYCISTNDGSYITLTGLTAEKANLDFHGAIYAPLGDTIIVDNCTSRYNHRGGISIRSDNSTVSNCTVYDCGEYGIGAGQDGTRYSNVKISGNTIYDNNNATNTDGILVIDMDVALVENNHVYSNNTGGSSDNIQIADSTDVVVRYNLLEDGGNTSIIATDLSGPVDIYYNIVIGGTLTGIAVAPGGAGDAISISNNTIFNDGMNTGLRYDDAHTNGLVIKNNVVHAGTDIAYRGVNTANVTADYNLYYNTSGTLIIWDVTEYTLAQFADYQSEKSQDANSIAVDPLFVDAANDDFRLQRGSPAKDVGTDVGLTQDFAGEIVPQWAGFDIGAHEVRNSVGSDEMISPRVAAVLESGAKASNDAANFVMCGPDVITNGDFAAATGWTLGANWAIAAGDCTHTTGAVAAFSQADIIKQHGAPYLLTFTTSTLSASTLIANVGGTDGTSRTTAATFTEAITASTSNRSLTFTPGSTSNAVVDNVILRPIVYANRVIIANSDAISFHVVCNADIGTESASATVFETVVGANSTYDLSEGGTRTIRTVSVWANGTLAAAGDMQVWGFA